VAERAARQHESRIMSDLNDLISRLPIDDLAAQLGADPADVRAAAEQVVPTLVAGVAAKSDRGEDVDTALAAQDSTLADGTINAGDVDVAQGEQLVQSLFGNDGGDVAQAVSGAVPVAGVDQSLVKKLLPLLAPIVLSYVLGKMGGGKASGGGLGDVLGGILGGGNASGGNKGGGIDLGSVLGSVLGGGNKGGGDNPLGGILGSILGGK